MTLQASGLLKHLRPLRRRVHREENAAEIDLDGLVAVLGRFAVGRQDLHRAIAAHDQTLPVAGHRHLVNGVHERVDLAGAKVEVLDPGLGVLVGIDPPLPELAGRWVLEPHQPSPGDRKPGQAPGRHGQVDEALGQPFRVDRHRHRACRRADVIVVEGTARRLRAERRRAVRRQTQKVGTGGGREGQIEAHLVVHGVEHPSRQERQVAAVGRPHRLGVGESNGSGLHHRPGRHLGQANLAQVAQAVGVVGARVRPGQPPGIGGPRQVLRGVLA